jgi:hypothetical protein
MAKGLAGRVRIQGLSKVGPGTDTGPSFLGNAMYSVSIIPPHAEPSHYGAARDLDDVKRYLNSWGRVAPVPTGTRVRLVGPDNIEYHYTMAGGGKAPVVVSPIASAAEEAYNPDVCTIP